jgi:glutamate-5-semialdehyde dehydrogenase
VGGASIGAVADAATAVTACGRAAKEAAASLATAPAEAIDTALREMARLLTEQAASLLDANAADVAAGEAAGLGRGLLDRLRLDRARLAEIARQTELLAATPFPPGEVPVRELGGGPSGTPAPPGGLVLVKRRIPVGVVGATYEARPDVTVDVASQLLKSRNAGVLRTGTAALRSAAALFSQVIAPAVSAAGLDPAALQLLPLPGHRAAAELVRHPDLIPLVILRGSGETTRALAAEAARHGVRTLAHADGGGVCYLDRAASKELAAEIIPASLDRLGVCNRLNLLLIDAGAWDELLAVARAGLAAAGVSASLPPHGHPLGQEWALVPGREATVTVAPASGPAEAARIANEHTSGLAASVVTQDPAAAREFLAAYTGTGAFWNASTRLLDGFKLLGVPETGINVDRLPGPRGPVTFRDLCLRQYVVTPREPGPGPGPRRDMGPGPGS